MVQTIKRQSSGFSSERVLPRHKRQRSYRARHTAGGIPLMPLTFVAWIVLCSLGMWLPIVTWTMSLVVYGVGVVCEIITISLDLMNRR